MPVDVSADTADAHFRWPLRIYWEDTDAGGVVFYANYLKFFERARTEWLRSLGCSQQALREQTGAIFVVTDTAVRYLQPARLDDEIVVSVALAEVGRVRLTLDQVAWRGDTRLAEGRIRVACVDAAHFKPCALPASLLARLISSRLSPNPHST
ncbi:MAG: tol-pal system-associated acyl-CoA thioesterase [Pseudomonadota bacterium]|jgi:acyl-CoA thioester hydrolase